LTLRPCFHPPPFQRSDTIQLRMWIPSGRIPPISMRMAALMVPMCRRSLMGGKTPAIPVM